MAAHILQSAKDTAAALLTAATLILSSCTRTVYTPVESAHTEYRDRAVERMSVDTVRDTRFILLRGDTVIDRRLRESIRYVAIHDTVRDTIRSVIREPYPVERPLSRWEKIKLDTGGIAIGAAIAALSLAAFLLVRRLRR